MALLILEVTTMEGGACRVSSSENMFWVPDETQVVMILLLTLPHFDLLSVVVKLPLIGTILDDKAPWR